MTIMNFPYEKNKKLITKWTTECLTIITPSSAGIFLKENKSTLMDTLQKLDHMSQQVLKNSK